MNKKDYIHSLKRVKLVIGNGFDLHCGLHTTYSDYYCQNWRKYKFIRDLFASYCKTNNLELDFNDKRISQINIWDLFFALNGPDDPKKCCERWCDIEKMMLSSFLKYDSANPDVANLVFRLMSYTNWRDIHSLIAGRGTAKTDEDRFIASFAKERMKRLNRHVDGFYNFLLDDLKVFEKNFGEFIYSQIHDNYLESINYYTQPFLNIPYIEMATDTLCELCDLNNLVGIDTFNYSYIHNEKVIELVQHINGSFKNPIFGIDTVFEPNDECFVFTKTARRIESDMFEEAFETKSKFENIIVFGHSLNEADYSYFFPAFDKLLLTDSSATNVAVFAYSVFDDNKKEEIKTDVRKAVSDIMYAYAKSKKLPDPGRFLDGLSTQKRIIMYEVPPLKREDYSYSHIDEEWDKTRKDFYTNNQQL